MGIAIDDRRLKKKRWGLVRRLNDDLMTFKRLVLILLKNCHMGTIADGRRLFGNAWGLGLHLNEDDVTFKLLVLIIL